MENSKQVGSFILAILIIFGIGAVANEFVFHSTFSYKNQYAAVGSLINSTTTVSTNAHVLPPESPTNYTDNKDGTITDNYTGLLWIKCTQGTYGNNCQAGSPSYREWSKARAECESLSFAGKTGWRLPTLKELQSIVDSGSYNPSINKDFFVATSDPYWTSTSPADHLTSEFTVLFSDGSAYYTNAGNVAATRCVYDGSMN